MNDAPTTTIEAALAAILARSDEERAKQGRQRRRSTYRRATAYMSRGVRGSGGT